MNNENMEIKYEKSNVPLYYINSANVTNNYYDFQCTFANQYINLENKNSLIKEELCKVLMSPEHAKVLSMILSNSVARYENRFGNIEIPKEILSRIENTNE